MCGRARRTVWDCADEATQGASTDLRRSSTRNDGVRNGQDPAGHTPASPQERELRSLDRLPERHARIVSAGPDSAQRPGS